MAAVLDLFSRRVVGWSMSAAMTAQFVAEALLMALGRRGKRKVARIEVYFGRGSTILARRQKIKHQTIALRRRLHQQAIA